MVPYRFLSECRVVSHFKNDSWYEDLKNFFFNYFLLQYGIYRHKINFLDLVFKEDNNNGHRKCLFSHKLENWGAT